MIEKFSLETQKVISYAESLAFSFGHSLIGSEHVLLSLLKHKEYYFTQELSKYGLTYEAIVNKIKKLYPTSKDEPIYMEYTIEMKILIEQAYEQSKQFRESLISPLSLSIALLRFDKGVACDLFEKYKINQNNLILLLTSQTKRKSELDSIIDLTNISNLKKDPLIGREKELEQLINVLSRRNKPNAILVGEPGVGKTAIVEELGRLLQEDKIPLLKGKTLYALDIASTVSGTKYRGEFEDKLKKTIRKVKEDSNAILFIDEIHTIVKAGGAEGAIDASNILKPYLARGEIQVIGATTQDEFQEAFDKDKALKRRFQVIKVEQNTPEETRIILKQLKPIYENYYSITIEDDLLDYIVTMTTDHMLDTYFPDKAIDLLDNSLVISKEKLTKENIDITLKNYYRVETNLKDKNKIVTSELAYNLYGQEEAITKISKALKSIELPFNEKNKPLLSMLFVGPSGVGKTTASQIIADHYFQSRMIYLNMSSYQEMSSLSKLIGNNPYTNEQSHLIKELKNNPHSLVVIDEMDKANIEVLDFIMNILDQGCFVDLKGNKIDCSNAMFVLISNYGFNNETILRNRLSLQKENNNQVMKKLQEKFRLEFLSRIDQIIVFNYLQENTLSKLANHYIDDYNKSLNLETSIMFDINEYHDEDYVKYGARNLKRKVKEKLVNYYDELMKEKEKIQ